MLRLRNIRSGVQSGARPLALVIDDEPDVATYLAAVLTDHGWRTRVEHRVDGGLEAARAETPDLVLLDVMMPERGGLSTLVAIPKDPRLASVPVVLVTGMQRQLTCRWEDMLHIARQFRPDAVIEKPVTPEHLVEVIDGILDRRANGSGELRATDWRKAVTEP